MKKTSFLFFLLLLVWIVPLLHASLLWHYSTDSGVSEKPVIYQGAVVVVSDDGAVYALDPTTGKKRWQIIVGKTPNAPFLMDNSLLISTTSGKVFKLTNGNIEWQTDIAASENASYIYGATANQNSIFVTANNGVYLLQRNGSIMSKIASFSDSIVTAPVAGSNYVIYGKESELIKLSELGQVQWRSRLSSDSFWLSKPIISTNTVYIGALDNKMHAYSTSNGIELWQVRTRNWIVSTPLIKDGIVYFGSNDGKIYAIDSIDGSVKWAAETQLAIQSQPESGLMGGQDVIFVGSTDKSMYAISKSDGEVLWKGNSAESAGSPLFYQNKVIFGSGDGQIYAYSTERACSITSPHEGELIGLKELVIRGKFISETGNAKVLVQINGGDWQEANTSDVDWKYFVDPKQTLVTGLNMISCQVTDSGGSESGTVFTTVTINHNPNIPISNLAVTVSPNIVEGKSFVIYVNDGDDSSPVDRFKLSINGKDYTSDRNISIIIPQSGTYTATVKKIGFKDAIVNITVNSSGVNPLYLGIGILLILVVIWQVWVRFLKQKFAAKKQ